jgi:hypothetical protein
MSPTTIKAYQDTEWGARAAWEAKTLIEQNLTNVEIIAWGVDKLDNVLWLNINSGDINMDIAISRKFMEYGFFRQELDKPDGYYRINRPHFLGYLERGQPGYFSMNGVGRYLYHLDLESPKGIEIEYVDHGDIPEYDDKKKSEAEFLEEKETHWAAEEKKRQASVKILKKKRAAAKA